MSSHAPDIDAFRAELQQQHADFVHVEPPRDSCAHIRFIGVFDRQAVIWDATVMRLDHYNRLAAHRGEAGSTQQFIEIGARQGDMRTIDIGLELERIDTGALLKTIIMVRKYKRLHPGRHEFGYRSLVRRLI